MMKKRTLLQLANSFLFIAIFFLAIGALPLDQFVQDRSDFSWKLEKVDEEASYRVYWLNVTSQIWGEDLVQEKIWTHSLKLTIPYVLQSPKALFVVQGGKTGDQSKPSSEALVKAALDTGTILAELKAVPNQPLLFLDQEKIRIEDGIVARTWRYYLEKKDPTIPLHFPMARAVVRGIDALDEFLQGQGYALEGVILAGESKRGWAAWLAAAVDSRVKGIIPIVCDFLNVRAAFMHQLESLGFFSNAIHDYLAEGIDDRWFDRQEFKDLMELVDPLAYSDRYTMPKFQINASGDPFSMPDVSQFSFGKLPAPKYLRYIPNTGHYLGNTDYLRSVAAFYRMLIHERSLPSFTWHRTSDGKLQINAQDRPRSVKLWKADNPTARDFRWDSTKRQWIASVVTEEDEGVYLIDLPQEVKGWAAYFAELEFDDDLTFTTEIFIVPDRMPKR
jgi:PhoPQ-activated pathogenicity-related protein